MARPEVTLPELNVVNRPYHTLFVSHKMISKSLASLNCPKRGSGKLRRAAREVHLRQVDEKRLTRGCAWVHGPEVLGLYRKRPLRGSVNHIGVGGRFRYSDLKEAAGYGI